MTVTLCMECHACALIRWCQLKKIEYDYADSGSGVSEWWLCEQCSKLSHTELEALRLGLLFGKYRIPCGIVIILTMMIVAALFVVFLAQSFFP